MYYNRVIKRSVHIVGFVTLSFILLSNQIIIADLMPSRGIGKTIRPRSDSSVRMVSEQVDITIDNNVAYVLCWFELKNEGPPDTLEVGFPRGWGEKELYDFQVWSPSELSFTVTEKKLDSAYKDDSGMEIPFWTTFTVPFEKTGQSIRIYISYNSILLRKDMTFSDILFRYILKTGAYWKGTIGEAKITVTLRNTNFDQITKISPKGFVKNINVMTWHFTDFEPIDDIELHIMQDVVYDRLNMSKMLLKENPDDAHGHYLLGTVYYGQSSSGARCQESLREFELAVANDPEHLEARWFLAMHYLDRPDKRLEQLEAIVKAKPDYIFTDEAFILKPSGYPNTNSARKWLDIINNNP